MKLLSLALVMLVNSFTIEAQIKDSLDNILLKVPASWEINRQATYTQLTRYNKAQNSFCQVAVYQQQPAAGDIYASFRKEWDQLLLAFFETPVTPSPQTKKIGKGTALYFGAQVINKTNQLPYYTELYVFDCGSNVQSVLVTSGSKKHLQFFDSSWQSLITGVRKSHAMPLVAATSDIPFKGLWSKASSSPMGLDPGSIITHVGYIKCQYDFRPDGTYTFRGEAGGGALRSNNFALIAENGKYVVSNNQLIITPAKSKLTSTDRNGNIEKTQNLDGSKRTYTWQVHYFEGINESQLILTPQKEYFQDGGLSAGSMFPDSYLYSQKYKPEWQIQLK